MALWGKYQGGEKELESDEAYGFPLEKANAYISLLMRQALATASLCTNTFLYLLYVLYM